jgi:hypothetical protein
LNVLLFRQLSHPENLVSVRPQDIFLIIRGLADFTFQGVQVKRSIVQTLKLSGQFVFVLDPFDKTRIVDIAVCSSASARVAH